MDLIIILFIIISIISSIGKQLKRTNKREKYFDPWSFGNDKEERLDYLNETSKIKNIEAEEIKNVEEEFNSQSKKMFSEEEDSEENSLLYQKTFHQESPIAEQSAEKKEDYTESSITSNRKKEEAPFSDEMFRNLLTDKSLPFAFIASEVIGLPISRKKNKRYK